MKLYKSLAEDKKFFLIAGPCVIESRDMVLEIAETLKEITSKRDIRLIFKASYKKANRTSVDSFVGYGMEEGLDILREVKEKYDLPILTDIHEVSDAEPVAQVADVLQIPAFLCRQTDLLLAAGKTGKIVNIKKGQFLAPENMKEVAEKVLSAGNSQIMLTERGTSFGYNELIVDFRSFAIMHNLGFPVIYDVTHSMQKPSSGKTTGGTPEFTQMMAKAAIATGKVDGLFIETHPNPKQARSDASTMLPLAGMPKLLDECFSIINRKQ